MKDIIIIGGDERQKCLKDIFTDEGYKCIHIDAAEKRSLLKEVKNCENIILPLPVSKDRIHIYSNDDSLNISFTEILDIADEKARIFGGAFYEEAKQMLKENQTEYFDFYAREDFAVYNAYLTAQGALRELLVNTQKYIISDKVLITGFGRVGKALAGLLHNIGMEAYICARNELQRTVAECSGYKTLSFDRINSAVYHFDYIFNTVPFNVFGFQDIAHFSGKYFELASAPFGTKKEFFEGKTENYIDCSSLPGRFLPEASAGLIAKSVIRYIRERKGGD